MHQSMDRISDYLPIYMVVPTSAVENFQKTPAQHIEETRIETYKISSSTRENVKIAGK